MGPSIYFIPMQKGWNRKAITSRRGQLIYMTLKIVNWVIMSTMFRITIFTVFHKFVTIQSLDKHITKPSCVFGHRICTKMGGIWCDRLLCVIKQGHFMKNDRRNSTWRYLYANIDVPQFVMQALELLWPCLYSHINIWFYKMLCTTQSKRPITLTSIY